MIISFLDREFKGLQNNASLVVDKASYNLIKRPVELNELSCTCEPFTEDIQPTFLVVKDDIGGYIYGALAGIPRLNNENKTEVTATDLKSMLSSDIFIQPKTYASVKNYIKYIFDEWNTQVNQGYIECELKFEEYGLIDKEVAGDIAFEELKPTSTNEDGTQASLVVDALEEIKSYLKRYNLYIDSKLILSETKDGDEIKPKRVVFTIGKTMYRPLNIKLWEYGIKDYGKWIASVNETQGYYEKDGVFTPSSNKWILTSQNQITATSSNRDIFPIKKKIVTSTESLLQADKDALALLLDNLFNEDIEIPATDVSADFETQFEVFTTKKTSSEYKVYKGTNYYNNSDTTFSTPVGILEKDYNVDYYNENYGTITIKNQSFIVKHSDMKPRPYKSLPCGALYYDANGLTKIQIGYRYTFVDFI